MVEEACYLGDDDKIFGHLFMRSKFIKNFYYKPMECRFFVVNFLSNLYFDTNLCYFLNLKENTNFL